MIKLLWTSAKLGITRKNVKFFFFTGKVTFFEKICFQLSLSWCRNDLVTCTIFVWLFFWANGIASWCRDTQNYERKLAKIIGEKRSVRKISIGFIGPNEIYNAKKCHEAIWAVMNCSQRFLILHRTRKEGQNNSFSNNCVFNSITGNTRKIVQNRFFQPEDGFFFKNFPLISHVFKKRSFDLHDKLQ